MPEVGLEDWRLLKNMPDVPIQGNLLIERNRIREGLVRNAANDWLAGNLSNAFHRA
jgi:hypothetical protein